MLDAYAEGTICKINCDAMKKDVVVLGLGNPLMSDEGVGCHIIEQFLAQSEKYPSVDFIDAGTSGIAILHYLANRRKAILVDCAYMGAKAGTIKRFTPDEVNSTKKLAHESLHQVDVLKIIDLAKQLNQCPQQLIIFGIEPESIKPESQLSKTVTAKIDYYIAAISKDLAL